MQRVSSLLPSWDRAKTADGASNSSNTGNTGSAGSNAAASAPTATSSTAANNTGFGFNNSSNNRSSTSSSISNITNNNSNRFSSNSAQLRNGNGGSFAKVFRWTGRNGGHKSLTVSPTIANAAATPSASGQMGREAYWPTSLDRECEKAARILKSFCTDGFLDDADLTPASPTTSRASINSLTSKRFSSRRSGDVPASPTAGSLQTKKKIPPRIIQDAVGLAIFSCMRSGLWMSGSGGSGILIARKADGTWSPPSGIILHTSTVAFVMGVDIYDCVLVINSVAALEMFTRSRVALGVDVPLTVGPLVTMGLLENDVRFNHELGHSVLTYLKARGRHSPAELTGSFVTERSNENERFYSEEGVGNGTQPINILDILAGNVRKSIPEILPLFEAIKAAEGRIDFDTATMDRLSQQPAPGDADIADTPGLLTPASPNSATFGVPDAADPDPFGIIALEMAGLEIREAGSKHRPTSHHFEYNNASPTSPVFASRFSRQSIDATALENGNNRASILSTRTQATSMTDACTQTDVGAGTPDTSLSPTHSDDGKDAQAGAARSVPSPVPELPVQTHAESEELAETAQPVEQPIEVAEPVVPVVPAVIEPAAVGLAIIGSGIGSSIGSGIPPPVPRRNRPPPSVNDSATDTASSKFLTVDRSMDTDDQLSDATDTAASSHFVEDERNEDADDEDEETDGLGDEGADDLDDGDDLDDDDDLDDFDDDDMEEEPVIFEVASTTVQPVVRVAPAQVATQVAQVIQAKGALVNIPKRIAPPLPVRSPARASRASKSDYGDLSAINSPLRHSFQSNLTVDTPADSLDAETNAATIVRSESTPAVIVATPAEEESSAHTSAYESAADLTAVEKTTTPAVGEDAEVVPTTPQTAEPTTSSIDDSDREPQTPRPADGTFEQASKIQKQHEGLDLEADHLHASSVAV
ncbi:hypothetical protein SBRCBS47491_001494 [Sporothrix bragantina]|uniref:Ysc84 actin-binding domain-containing protein n=1 Tax=Sporothrix bragantina TaxID=671064 RepID=A0ABP0AZ86_9PEZI